MRARVRTPRRRRSRRRDLAVAGVTVLLAAGLLVLGATAQRGLPGAGHYELRARFDDAANLGNYADVRIAGRRVGQVLDVDAQGRAAEVRLQLDPEVRPLPAGTRARIRLKGLLGAKFVELLPAGSGAPLPDGARIEERRTSTTVELGDVLAEFDGPRRRALRRTIDALGAGFLGRGDELNAALTRLPQALEDLGSAVRAVNARRGAAEGLAPGLDAAAAAVDPAAADLAAGWAPTRRALAPVAARRSDVRRLLERSPGALQAARAGLSASDPLLVQTARLSRAVARLTEPAPSALRRVRMALDEGRRPLTSARGLLQDARSAVDPTLRLVGSVRPLVEPVTRGLRGAVPTLAVLDEYGCDVLGTARNWRSMLSWGLDRGAPVGPETVLRVTVAAEPGETPKHVIGDLPRLTERASSYPPPCLFGAVPPQIRRAP